MLSEGISVVGITIGTSALRDLQQNLNMQIFMQVGKPVVCCCHKPCSMRMLLICSNVGKSRLFRDLNNAQE